MICKKADALNIEKNGVKMRIYNSKDQCGQAAVVYQETEKGHSEEFLHKKSYFIFYIIEGSGTWYIEDKPSAVSAGDVVIVPPNTRFYYRGKLKQICVTSPAWEAEFEQHIKDIQL
jgi:mannose-6-phosphate isomerase-like protein (cupin superfamily)